MIEESDAIDAELVKLHESALAEAAKKIKPEIAALEKKKDEFKAVEEEIAAFTKEIEAVAEMIGALEEESAEERKSLSMAESALHTLENSKKAFVAAKNFKQASATIARIKEQTEVKNGHQQKLTDLEGELAKAVEDQGEILAKKEQATERLNELRASLGKTDEAVETEEAEISSGMEMKYICATGITLLLPK